MEAAAAACTEGWTDMIAIEDALTQAFVGGPTEISACEHMLGKQQGCPASTSEDGRVCGVLRVLKRTTREIVERRTATVMEVRGARCMITFCHCVVAGLESSVPETVPSDRKGFHILDMCMEMFAATEMEDASSHDGSYTAAPFSALQECINSAFVQSDGNVSRQMLTSLLQALAKLCDTVCQEMWMGSQRCAVVAACSLFVSYLLAFIANIRQT